MAQLHDLNALEAAAAVRRREVSPSELTAHYLDRIQRLDDQIGAFVTITDVRVTGDLQHASVFYTVYGSDEERADSAAALKSATGMLRSEVGKNITARLTPSLEFIADAVPENGRASCRERVCNDV